MRKLAMLTFCIAALAVSCGPGEPESVDTGNTTGKSPAEIEANFTRVRGMQDEVLSETAGVVARAETATVEELEAGMKRLNEVLLIARQESDYMRVLDTEESKPRMKELRKSTRLIRQAYAKLVEQHPNPSPDLMLVDDVPAQ